MGTLCSKFDCVTENVALTTPFGSCSCGRSICGCKGKIERETSDQKAQQAMTDEIANRVKEQLSSIETLMHTMMTQHTEKFGVVPAIQILERGCQSPPPSSRTLTVRVCHPLVEDVLTELEDHALPIAIKLAEVVAVAIL